MKKWISILCIISCILMACQSQPQKSESEEKNLESSNRSIVEESSDQEEQAISIEDEGLPILTLRILLPNTANPDLNALQQSDREMEKSANQYLREQGKEYRVQYQTQQIAEHLPSEEEITGADLICSIIPPEEENLYYLDINDELKEGKLKALYESVPELYWQRVNVKGSIYSWLAVPPNVQTIMIIGTGMQGTAKQDIPEELIGEPLDHWQEYLKEVYEEKGQKPYIFSAGIMSGECPISDSSAWNARFQLVLPFLGIDPENPELGVQCIYESEYGKSIQELWCELCEQGYMFYSKGSEENTASWIINTGYSIDAVYELDAAGSMNIPLQKHSYASPHLVGINYYSSGISKNCKQLDLVYQFINDLCSDEKMQEAIVRKKDGSVWFHIIPQTLIFEENGQGIYIGTLEENRAAQERNFAAAKMPPAPGFLFDTEPVQKEVDAIMSALSWQELSTQLKRLTMEGKMPEYAVDIHYIQEDIMDILYEQGLQKVIDEANRQLDEYMNQ